MYEAIGTRYNLESELNNLHIFGYRGTYLYFCTLWKISIMNIQIASYKSNLVF